MTGASPGMPCARHTAHATDRWHPNCLISPSDAAVRHETVAPARFFPLSDAPGRDDRPSSGARRAGGRVRRFQFRSEVFPVMFPRRTLTRLVLAPLALLGGLSLPAAAGDEDVEIIQFLASTGEDPNGTCRLRWRQDADSTDFNVELEDLDAGSYSLWVAGVSQGNIEVDGTGQGEIEFETPQDGLKPLLDFEVLDQEIMVTLADVAYFSGTFDGSGSGGGGGGGGGSGGKLEVFMVNVGPDGNAKGRLRHEVKGGKVRFDFEVENLDSGTYQLHVAGAPVAEFAADGVETEVEFQDPVESGKVLLNFEPLGAQVDVVSGGTTYLTAVMPAAGTGAPSTAKKGAKDTGKSKGDALEVVLLNLGVAPAASGKAELSVSGETEFEVEFEDAPALDWELLVGGVSRGALSGVTAGQWKFSTSPEAGESLLDFEVQGQLVEISDGVDTILSVVFPVSVQAALGTWKKEIRKTERTKVNLVPSGADLDARGLADFKDKASKDTFVVSVFDLAAGSYDLVVGAETVAGALVVTAADGKAKVSFDTSPKGKKLLLDFAVPGQVVQVTPAGEPGTVLLEVVIE